MANMRMTKETDPKKYVVLAVLMGVFVYLIL